MNIFGFNKKNKDTTDDHGFKDVLSTKSSFKKKRKSSKTLFEKVTTTPYTQSFEEELYEEEQKQLPVIGHLENSTQYKIAVFFAVFSICIAVAGASLYGVATKKENLFIQASNDLSTDLQKVNLLFSETILGKDPSVENVLVAIEKTNNDFTNLKIYDSNKKSINELENIQTRLQKNLKNVNDNVNVLVMKKDILMNSNAKVAEFNNDILQINNNIDSFNNLYLSSNLNQNELINSLSLKTTIQNINNNLITILLSEKISIGSIDSLNKAKQELNNNLSIIKDGDINKGIKRITQTNIFTEYQKVEKSWSDFSNKIDVISAKGADLIQIRDLLSQNEKLIDQIIQDNNEILRLHKNNDLTGLKNTILIIALGVIMFIFSLIVVFYIYSFEMDNIRLLERIENNKNHNAMLKLTDELGPLQDGDLTKKTTVKEGITLMIADSVNATIDSLSSLVKKIKDSSLIMREKTNSVKLISLEMLASNEKQATNLNDTGNSVINITEAIKEISTKTEEGAKEAQKSVAVSEEGLKQVQDSVKAMEEINNNINETVHLMKKVSDSSKQISEIIELLSDITESTSILALNATVQASKAGEAGKGFKIVADSIQELADNASNQNRRVGALISTVQTDIIAVEKAVHKTTEEVSKGVELSKKAGESLNKITIVSRNLSQLVGFISEETKSHSISAKNVSESMQEILKTTEENKKSTEKTVNSISEIAEIANELGHSVQTFQIT